MLRYGAFVGSVGGVRVAGILITSVTFPYIVRRLGVQEYGVWSYVIAICAFLDLIANPGLTTFAGREIAARRESAFEFLSDILGLRLLASILAAMVLTGIVLLDPQSEIHAVFFFYGIGILLSSVMGVDYVLNALEMFHAASALRISQQILYAIGIFIFVRTSRDLSWLAGSILVSTFLTNLAGWYVLSRRALRFRLRFRVAAWKEIVIPSIHYAGSSLMSNLYHRTGHILVRWFLGEYALGIYAAAVRLVDLARNFVAVLLQVLGPRLALSTRSQQEFRRWAQVAMAAVALSSIPLTIGLVMMSKWVVRLAMGPQYYSAVPLVKWMAPYIISASAASLLAGTILYSMGRPRAYFASTAAGAIAGVILYSLLVPTLGLTGAAVAFVVAEFVVAGTAYFLLPGDLRGLWKSPAIGAALISGVLMLLVLRVAKIYMPEPIIAVLTGAAIYTVLCAWFLRKWASTLLGAA